MKKFFESGGRASSFVTLGPRQSEFHGVGGNSHRPAVQKHCRTANRCWQAFEQRNAEQFGLCVASRLGQTRMFPEWSTNEFLLQLNHIKNSFGLETFRAGVGGLT